MRQEHLYVSDATLNQEAGAYKEKVFDGDTFTGGKKTPTKVNLNEMRITEKWEKGD